MKGVSSWARPLRVLGGCACLFSLPATTILTGLSCVAVNTLCWHDKNGPIRHSHEVAVGDQHLQNDWHTSLTKLIAVKFQKKIGVCSDYNYCSSVIEY